MKKGKIWGHYNIESDCLNYELSCNIDMDKGDEFYFPSLELKAIKSKEYPAVNESWDNDEYLMVVHDLLQKVENKEILSATEQYELQNIETFIPRDDFETVLLMLKKGISLGFFNEYFTNKEAVNSEMQR